MVESDKDMSAFDLSSAFDNLFDFERELEGLSGLSVPHAANAMAEAFEQAGDRIETALNRAAKTGELNFEAMVTSILSDLARIGAGAVLDQVMSGLGSGMVASGPVSVNVNMPEGSDASSLVAAQGQIAAALTQALASGARWS